MCGGVGVGRERDRYGVGWLYGEKIATIQDKTLNGERGEDMQIYIVVE